jgi:hypothetical protein
LSTCDKKYSTDSYGASIHRSKPRKSFRLSTIMTCRIGRQSRINYAKSEST